jgi:chromosome segregation ATPase
MVDYNKINKEGMDSSLMKVEALQKEYEVTLQQYQEAMKNYISSLQTTDAITEKSYVARKERAWWGTGKLEEGEANTQQECEAMCANSSNCSGATFNPVKRYCWTRSGDGPLTPSEPDDYALIPKQKSAIIAMKSLNEKLLSINQQIISEMSNIDPAVKQQDTNRNTTYKELDSSYQNLLEQKMEMEKQLREYYSVEEDYDNQTLYVNQKALSMKIWVIVCAVVLLVTMSKMYGEEGLPSFIKWPLIIIIVLVVLTTIMSPSYK